MCPANGTTYVDPIPGDLFLYPPTFVAEEGNDGKVHLYATLPQTAPWGRHDVTLTFLTQPDCVATNNPAIPITCSESTSAQTWVCDKEPTIDDLIAYGSVKATNTADTYTYTWRLKLAWIEKASLISVSREDLLFDRAMDEVFTFTVSVPRTATINSDITLTTTQTLYAVIVRALLTVPMSLANSKITIIFKTRPTDTNLYIKTTDISVYSKHGIISSVTTPVIVTGAGENEQNWNTTITLGETPCELTGADTFTIRVRLSPIANDMSTSVPIDLVFALSSSADWCHVDDVVFEVDGIQQTYLTSAYDATTTLFWAADYVYIGTSWTTTAALTITAIDIDEVFITCTDDIIAVGFSGNLVTTGTSGYAVITEPTACDGDNEKCYKFGILSGLLDSTPASSTGTSINIQTKVTITYLTAEGAQKKVAAEIKRATQVASGIRMFANARSDAPGSYVNQMAVVASVLVTLAAIFF
jgi:hypothetical protein